MGAPPQAQTAAGDLLNLFDSRWIWHQCGDDPTVSGLLRVASVGPLPGHCFHFLVSCPWLRSCLEKSNCLGGVVHFVAAAERLTHGCHNRLQHLVVVTYVTALASATV